MNSYSAWCYIWLRHRSTWHKRCFLLSLLRFLRLVVCRQFARSLIRFQDCFKIVAATRSTWDQHYVNEVRAVSTASARGAEAVKMASLKSSLRSLQFWKQSRFQIKQVSFMRFHEAGNWYKMALSVDMCKHGGREMPRRPWKKDSWDTWHRQDKRKLQNDRRADRCFWMALRRLFLLIWHSYYTVL